MTAITALRSATLFAGFSAAFLLPAAIAQERAELASPDGRITAEIWSEDGRPHYSVSFDGEEVVAPSRLGFRLLEGPNLETGLELVETGAASHDDEWELPWGERRVARDHHNEVSARFEDAESPELGFTVRMRAFDTGIGFRYEVSNPERGEHAITAEITEFVLPPESDAWWIEAGEYNRYEYLYRSTPLSDALVAHTPFTARLPEGGPHVSIHEAALVDYSSMWLDQRRGGVFRARLAPSHDGVPVRVGGEFATPWRTIQIADSAVGLINSDIILNLNEPNVLGDVSWVEPGKYIGIWWGMHVNTMTWESGEIHGATTENAREYIDFAAENGFDGVLIEGWNLGWDGNWFVNNEVFDFTTAYPDFDLEGVAAYARERGVRLVGHHETSGGVSNYEDQMEDAFDLYERLGVRQVKTGYVDDAGGMTRRDEDGHIRYEWHDGQFAVNHHQRVLQAAAERRISINAHEPVKDTGLRRTYPNAITREGARGQEYNAWGVPPNPPEHVAILPYTRMLSGPFDYTPGIFDMTSYADRMEGARVSHTLAKELALYVVIYSPVQMVADLPENYERFDDAFDFIRAVPADWEESIALDGEIGEHVVFARQERGSDDWYLGALTDEDPRDLSVALDFLEEGRTYTATIWRDAGDAHWDTNPYAYEIEERQVTSADTLDLPLAPGGGAAVRFAAE
ncbi:glycoside hydrolase family 97 protein [Glycocaulis profundi]|nr:glycoside hydrolase family 97 protein [Glycocaulis profundi]